MMQDKKNGDGFLSKNQSALASLRGTVYEEKIMINKRKSQI